jgi:hypothetical protein
VNLSIDDKLRIIRDFFTPVPAQGVAYRIINGHSIGSRSYGGWAEKRGAGYEVTYERTETYSGTTLILDLDFATQAMLKRIELMWNDATSKDYEIRVFSDFNNSSLYSLIKKETGNTETSEITFMDFVYPPGARVQLYFENYTAGKICKVLVAMEEL